MTNVELRDLAWRRLWTDKWFGRLFGGALLLQLCGQAMNTVVGGILRRLNVPDWQEYCIALAKNRRDLTTPVPNLTQDFIFQASSSLVLQMFISCIMTGIMAYGCAVILRKCLANEEEGWFGSAFGGFKVPFDMLWLFLRQMFIFLGWLFVAVLPVGLVWEFIPPLVKRAEAEPAMTVVLAAVFSALFLVVIVVLCIPFYRYRFLWLVKAEHPDWSAGECLRSCRRLMKGNMMRSFRLDCSYWKPITLVLLLAAVVVGAVTLAAAKVMPILLAFVAFVATLGLMAASIVLGQYIGVGQGFLYRELKDAQAENGQKGL